MTPVQGKRRPITNFGGPRPAPTPPRPITNFGGPRPAPTPPRPITNFGGPRGPLGGVGGPRPFNPRFGVKKKGGEIKTKSFPDLTGDGKVTMKDILKGRGVIKKKGGMMKKADGGLIRMHKQMAMSTKKFT